MYSLEHTKFNIKSTCSVVKLVLFHEMNNNKTLHYFNLGLPLWYLSQIHITDDDLLIARCHNLKRNCIDYPAFHLQQTFGTHYQNKYVQQSDSLSYLKRFQSCQGRCCSTTTLLRGDPRPRNLHC